MASVPSPPVTVSSNGSAVVISGPLGVTREVDSDYEFVGGLRQKKVLLCDDWRRIDSEGLIQKVREQLDETQNDCVDDTRILRYLLGHNCNLEKIVGILKRLAVYEREVGIPKIRQDAVRLGWKGLPHLEIIQSVVPMTPCAGLTKDGSPYSIYKFGSVSITSAKKHNNHDDIEKIKVFSRHANELESTHLLSRTKKTGYLVGIYQIFDLGGLGMKHIWNKNLMQTMLKPVIEEASTWYPETTVRTFIINAPLLFRAVWQIIKLWLDERQVYKCQVSSGIPDELRDIIGEDNLPRCLGGEAEDPVFNLHKAN